MAASVAGRAQDHDPAVVEDVVVAVELLPVEVVIEVGLNVDRTLVDRWVARELELLSLHEHGGVAQPLEPARVVEVQMRLDHDVDVARLHPDRRQAPLDVVIGRHLHLERGGSRAKPRLRVGPHRGVHAAVEQDRCPAGA